MKKLILTLFITLFSILASLGQNIAELKQKAEQGDAKAQYIFGCCYAYGMGGVKKDLREAVKWFRKAAEQGHAKAQYCLALCYFNGECVEKDTREAVKWFSKSAEQGNVLAQNNLGYCYAYGVEKDLREAVKWYRKAAEQGYADAQCSLGVYYAKGDGVIQNNVKAYAWLALALANGSEKAKKEMDFLKKEMTPNQIVEAQKLAEKYYNGKLD